MFFLKLHGSLSEGGWGENERDEGRGGNMKGEGRGEGDGRKRAEDD